MGVFARPAHGAKLIANGTPFGEGDVLFVKGDELMIVALGPTALTALSLGAPEGQHSGVVASDSQERSDLEMFANELLRNARQRDNGVPFAFFGLLERSRGARETAAHRRRMALFTAAQEYLWSHIDEPHHIDALCNALQCNVRTLFYAFKSVVGMSPMKYFKIQRLNAAHRKLRSSNKQMPIFCVAADCGFWHMGHFGVDYKRLFGCNASTVYPVSGNDTARRSLTVVAGHV